MSLTHTVFNPKGAVVGIDGDQREAKFFPVVAVPLDYVGFVTGDGV
jgi:hypothetical protein